MWSGHAGAVAVVVLVVAAPAVARACSCGIGVDVVWPQASAIEVPINARVWVGQDIEEFGAGLNDPRLRLVGEELGVEFTTSVIDTAAGPLTVFTPDQPLTPTTRYELVDCYDDTCDRVVTHFTTGAAVDHEAPALPVETDRDGGAQRLNNDSCGKTRWARVGVESEGLVIMQIDAGSLDPATLSGETSFASFAGDIFFGVGACYVGWPVGEKDAAEVRYGAFDVAGNFSGWTEPEQLRLGRGCGCRSDAPAGSAWLGLGLLGFGLRRRRPVNARTCPQGQVAQASPRSRSART